MMTEERLRDISISGTGVINGGQYDKVKISGSGRIEGDVQATSITISGSSAIEGNVRTGNMNLSGSAKIQGSVRCEKMTVSGTLRIDDKLEALEIKHSGSMRVDESVKAGKITTRGAFSVDDDVVVEEFHATGSVHVDDTLEAKKLQLKMSGKCYAEHIRGEIIEVTLSEFSVFSAIVQFFSQLFTGKGGWNRLETEAIEGSKISIEYVDAKLVRGDEVWIGPKCDIDVVEYRTSIKIDPKARVKKHVQI